MRLYQRVGLSRAWALLVFTSLLIPFLGFLLVLLPLAFKVWPNFPKSMPAPKPVKTPL
jgi:predicted PurR-regulated permease PerM